jgi:hypothetical protein
MSKSKNEIAWEKIFEKYKILQKISTNGYTLISSNEINEFREARLMTKFDHRSQLIKLFTDNGLSILPTSRGGYIIGAFEVFHDFNQNEIEITRIDFPTFLESLDYKDITSEITALNCAFVTKILHNFTGEDNLFPTVSGRMSSSSFEFNINSTKGLFKINVDNSQVVIDGGYEGDSSLSLIKAKNYLSDDFLVRQLYYPYKLWCNKVYKRVRPIFLTYTNGIFDLREYTFDDINHYNSLRLIKQKKYAVQDGSINIEIIQRIMDITETVREPEIPFPQANSFERVVNLCELLNQKSFTTKEEITENYDFDARQTDYYTNAGKYLGLINSGRENGQIVCYLTKTGQRLFSLSIVDRQTEFVKLILSHLVFKKTLKLYFNNGNIPTKEEIIELMKYSKLYKVDSDTTYFRRASTILGWVNWILNQIEE